MIFILFFIHKDFKAPLDGIFFWDKQYALTIAGKQLHYNVLPIQRMNMLYLCNIPFGLEDINSLEKNPWIQLILTTVNQHWARGARAATTEPPL